MLGITIYSLPDLERLLRASTLPTMPAVSASSTARPRTRSPLNASKLAAACQPSYQPPTDPCVLPKALLVMEAAKEVSQPDS